MDLLVMPMSKDDELIKKVIDTWVLRNGYSEVKASIDGFDSPSTLSYKDSEDKLTPDIMAMKRGARYYIEVVRKDQEPEKTVSKWKLLSVLGKNKGGGLILIAPAGSFAFAERLIKKYDIQAQIIKF